MPVMYELHVLQIAENQTRAEISFDLKYVFCLIILLRIDNNRA